MMYVYNLLYYQIWVGFEMQYDMTGLKFVVFKEGISNLLNSISSQRHAQIVSILINIVMILINYITIIRSTHVH